MLRGRDKTCPLIHISLHTIYENPVTTFIANSLGMTIYHIKRTNAHYTIVDMKIAYAVCTISI